MIISNLYIKNFRNFGQKGINIDFDDNLTAIIGKNGAGKTTIIEAINYILSNEYLSNKISERDFNCKANKISDTVEIIATFNKFFFLNVETYDDKYSKFTKLCIPCNKVKLTIKRRQKAEKILDDPFIINKTVIPVIGDIPAETYDDYDGKNYKVKVLKKNDDGLDLDEAKEIISNLLSSKTTNISLGEIEKSYQAKYNLKSGGERTAVFSEFYFTFNPNKIKGFPKSYYLNKDRDNEVSGTYSLIGKILTDLHWKYKRNQSKINKDIVNEYETLATNLRQIVDEKQAIISAINEQIKLVSKCEHSFRLDFIDIEQPYRQAFISKVKNNKMLLPQNLGSGYNILIAFALFKYVAKNEKIPIILLIDEPELHLHTDWQKNLYNLLSNQKILQIIYSTQSENLILLKEWKQIKLLKKCKVYPQKTTLTEAITTSNGETASRSQYLDDYSSKNLYISSILKENLELFFTKKVILIEGPGEKYSIPKLLSLHNFDINDYSVSLIPVWGKTKIKTYQMICKCFGVDFFTLFDGDDDDGTDSSSNKQENISIKNDSLNYFEFEGTNFEKLLGITSNNHKFAKLVEKIDSLTDLTGIDTKIIDALNAIETFIKTN